MDTVPFAEAPEGGRSLNAIRPITRTAIPPAAAKPATLCLINFLYPSLIKSIAIVSAVQQDQRTAAEEIAGSPSQSRTGLLFGHPTG
jgi:hypothetical protein